VREWSCDWEGVTIAVKRWMRGLRTGERLFVAGRQVDATEAWVWSRMSVYLAALVVLRDTPHLVEVVIGLGQGTVSTCCKTFVDGQPVGGDIKVSLVIPDVREWERTRDAGLMRFLLTTGLRRFGLPYAVAAGALSAAFARDRDMLGVAAQWTVAGILFGLIMGVIHWRTAEATFRLRQAKRRQVPRRVG